MAPPFTDPLTGLNVNVEEEDIIISETKDEDEDIFIETERSIYSLENEYRIYLYIKEESLLSRWAKAFTYENIDEDATNRIKTNTTKTNTPKYKYSVPDTDKNKAQYKNQEIYY